MKKDKPRDGKSERYQIVGSSVTLYSKTAREPLKRRDQSLLTPTGLTQGGSSFWGEKPPKRKATFGIKNALQTFLFFLTGKAGKKRGCRTQLRRSGKLECQGLKG